MAGETRFWWHPGYSWQPGEPGTGSRQAAEDADALRYLEIRAGELLFDPVRALIADGHLLGDDDAANDALEALALTVSLTFGPARLAALGPRRRRLILSAIGRRLEELTAGLGRR